MEQYLMKLEQEAIELIREVITTNDLRKVWLYATGKELCVMHHILTKAFYPRPVNLRFIHFDMGCESDETRQHIDRLAKDNDLCVCTVKAECDLRLRSMLILWIL